jgi:cell wall-associated NlpC family hydrolase
MSDRELDPRLHAYRDDIAAVTLKDRVRARRYVEATSLQVIAPHAPLRIAPKFHAPLLTEALHGELVNVYDTQNGWAWVQLQRDQYVGYMPGDHLSSNVFDDTHKVRTRATFVYPAPDIKTPPLSRLTFGSTVSVDSKEGRFAGLSRGGFVYSDHLSAKDANAKDFVRSAERLVGTPYLWGGKTSLGLDCSALVQLALHDAGIACPRDADMQVGALGQALPNYDISKLKRGDLIFWKGHVAIAKSESLILHASGHHMEVVIEPTARAIERIIKSWGPVLSVRRLELAGPVTQPDDEPEPESTAAPPPAATA